MDKVTSKARFLLTSLNNTYKLHANKRKNIIHNRSLTKPIRAMKILVVVTASSGTIINRKAPTKFNIVRIR